MNRTIDTPFKKPLVIGHRGFKARYPENTMAGFRAALASSVAMIELDVQLSSDGHPVVIHDDDLDRTTDGKGPVTALSLSELKKLDAGSWFDPQFANESIPTLAEVLNLVGNRALINVEIKVKPDRKVDALQDIDIITLSLIRRKKLEKQVLISSFNKYVLERISRMDQPPALGVLTEFGEDINIFRVCQTLGAFSWHPYFLEVDKEKITRMHQKGIRVMPYTVNSPNEMKMALNTGVDGFFTDDPIVAGKMCGL